MGKHVYVERADPGAKGYEVGTRRWFNVIDRYNWANEYVKGITVDMPCGIGWGTSYLTNASIVFAVDICRGAIDRAKRLYPKAAKFYVDDMLGTHFMDNFADSLVCCEGYEHVGRRAQFLLMNEIHRIVKRNGTVLLTVPFAKFKGDHTGNKFHLHEPTIEEVEETLVGKFEVLELIKPNVARYRLRVLK